MNLLKKLALLLVLFAWGFASPAAAKKPAITVMTQNQFLGADLAPLLGAAASGDVFLLIEVLGQTLDRITANDFPVRATALAEQICDSRSHVVGLQEVYRFSLGGESGAPPYVDHLSELMDAIDADCANYVVAASLKNFEVAQFIPPFGLVGITDRDVILVRDDVPFAPVPYSGNACTPTESGIPGLPASGCHFQALVPLPPSVGDAIARGYLGVDAELRGETYRVVNTHLEVQRPDGSDLSSLFQALQMAELIQVMETFPEAPGTRTILVGDINSSPEDPVLLLGDLPPGVPLPPPFGFGIVPPYTQLVEQGYDDAWKSRGNKSGETCCNDEDLAVTDIGHGERIDVIFSREPLKKSKTRVLGGREKDRIDGLWPSDHCSVAGRLSYPAPRK